jgi:cytochrome c-type biogenesis protein CcmH
MRWADEPVPSADRQPDTQASPVNTPLASASVATAPMTAPPSLGLQAGFAAAVLVLAALGYSVTGSNVRTPPPSMAMGVPVEEGTPDQGAGPVAAEVNAVVERLAQRLKGMPDDVAGWTLLARAYTAMGRFDEAVVAYDKVLALAGETADMLADSADAIVARHQGRLTGEAALRIERALSLEPDNRKALALAGSAAFDIGDYAAAVRYWERVAATLPAESPLRAQLQASVAQARHLGRLPAGEPAAPPSASAPGVEGAQAPVPGSAKLTGNVTLAAGLLSKVTPDDTVFIAARAVEGTRMPLAVLRVKAKDLPVRFTLDDSMAMAPGVTISSHAQVVVTARVSRSGDAAPQAGDLTGQSGVVSPGASGIAVQINAVVGQ